MEEAARAETDPSLWARADEAKIDRFIIKYKSSNAFIGESTSPNEQAILAAAEEKVTEEKELRAQRETALITKLEAENRTAGEIEAEIQQAKLQTKTKTLEAAAFSYQPDATVQREAMLNTSVAVSYTHLQLAGEPAFCPQAFLGRRPNTMPQRSGK